MREMATMTTLSFHTIVPSDGTITLPSEFRGVPVKIVVAKEPAPSKRSTMREFDEKKPTPVNGIMGLRGILKGYTIEELENARDEHLTDKYIHD